MKNKDIDQIKSKLEKQDFQGALNIIDKIKQSVGKLSDEDSGLLNTFEKNATLGKQIAVVLKRLTENYVFDDSFCSNLNSLKDLINKNKEDEYEYLDFEHLDSQISEMEMSYKSYIENKHLETIKSDIEEREDFEGALLKYEELNKAKQASDSIILYLERKINKRCDDLFEQDKLKEFKEFISFISNYKSFDFLSERKKKEKRGELKTRIKELADHNKTEEAKRLLNDAKAVLEESSIEELSQYIHSIEEKKRFNRLVKEIREALESYDTERASALLSEAGNNPMKDDSIIETLREDIQKTQHAIDEEKKYKVPQPLCLIKGFNIPKPEMDNEGEDADPYINVDSGKNWGVIGVFDGMGGAGARKYKHEQTQEEHSSAYWASRYVREAINTMMEQRPIGTHPIDYMEERIHQVIVDKLQNEISNFPNASSIMSKMIRKLPTTMALATYFIQDGLITINCYWVGDSRIYYFDKNSIKFLTIDDANAPDNDPFSPDNMDLAMNNAICQDREFYINKSTIEMPFDKSNPVLLMAATDGCFGYFKNPIEFELMLRDQLNKSDEWGQWSDGVKEAIRLNGHHDDFSMTMVAIGVEENEFYRFQEIMTPHIKKESIFSEYIEWKSSASTKQKQIDEDINNLNAQMEQNRVKKEKCIERKNLLRDSLNKLINAFDDLKSLILDFDQHHNIEELKDKVNHEIELCKEDEFNTSNDTVEKEKILLEKKKFKEDLIIKCNHENNQWYIKYKEQFAPIVNNKLEKL